MNFSCILKSACVALLLLVSTTAYALSNKNPPAQYSMEQTSVFAKKVMRAAAQRGARVFIVSRVGQPPEKLPKGINFTHVAFAVYSKIETVDGHTVPGYAVYNLYQDDTKVDSSALVQDYPLDYFTGVFDLRSGIIIPSVEMQKRLLNTIFSDTYRSLHNPRYSVLSNPFNSKYQNCTEFVLDVLHAAIYATDDKRQIKKNIETYYEPQHIKISRLSIWFSSLFNPDVKLSDHRGKVKTSTFSTLAAYMKEHNLADEVMLIKGD